MGTEIQEKEILMNSVMVSTGKHFNYNGGLPFPSSDPSIWNVDEGKLPIVPLAHCLYKIIIQNHVDDVSHIIYYRRINHLNELPGDTCIFEHNSSSYSPRSLGIPWHSTDSPIEIITIIVIIYD